MKYYRWVIIAAWVAIVALCALFWRPMLFVLSLLLLLLIMVIKGGSPGFVGPIPNEGALARYAKVVMSPQP